MAAILVFLLLSAYYYCTVTAQQTYPNINLGSILSPTTNTSSWLSPSGKFAFGFYPQGQGFAIGIWYTQVPEKTVLWTANRDEPPVSSNATLLFANGSLILQPGRGQDQLPVSNASEAASSASMLDTGNFVLYNSKSKIVWQTFDFPTNTILQGQRMLPRQELVSSVSETDQSTGRFRLKMQHDGNLVQYPVGTPDDKPYAYWGTSSIGDNITAYLDVDGHFYLLNSNGSNIYNMSNDGLSANKTTCFRVTIDVDGILRLYSHGSDGNGNWSMKWSSSNNKCDPKGICGLNQYCFLIDEELRCSCLPGFDFIDGNQTSTLGCHQMNYSTESSCGSKQKNILIKHTMSTLENTVWEDNPYSVLKSTTKQDCEVACSDDCYCEAALFQNQECRKQKIPLRFGKRELDGEGTTTAFIKVSTTSNNTSIENKVRKKEMRRMDILIVGVVLVAFAFIVLAISSLLIYRNRVWVYSKIKEQRNVEMKEEIFLRSFTYSELEKATDGFKEQVGRGSTGTVFKGVLVSPAEQRVIAVKRLERLLEDDEREFQTEMRVIGKTHHRNLVRLLGYCHEGPNRLLVYEYMTNGSLARLLYTSGRLTTWDDRVGIALDIARGILYLHEECETQIIHCDIKPQNILMDDHWHAKIADFGLSKLLDPYQTGTITSMRGTRGYVAPEWLRNVHKKFPITVKVDVYSFGVVLLEIICRRRHVDSNVPEEEGILVDWVYNCFEAGDLGKLVGDEEVDTGRLERMVRVALWCLQEDPAQRPSMKTVMLMLEETVDIPAPPIYSGSFDVEPLSRISDLGPN